jgi:hypothetical protein
MLQLAPVVSLPDAAMKGQWKRVLTDAFSIEHQQEIPHVFLLFCRISNDKSLI